MKNYLKYSISALVMLFSLTACLDDDDACLFIGGAIETRELALNSMEGIELSFPARLLVWQDSIQRIQVTGNADLLDILSPTIEDDIWRVRTPTCVRGNAQLEVIASLPTIRFLGITGVGEIISENVIFSQNLELSVSGSGNMDIGADVDVLNVGISGEATIRLEGISDVLDYRLSGAGTLNAFDLVARELAVRISGAGNAEVTAMEVLDVRISGVGNVLYKGQPSISQSISGEGSVVDAN